MRITILILVTTLLTISCGKNPKDPSNRKLILASIKKDYIYNENLKPNFALGIYIEYDLASGFKLAKGRNIMSEETNAPEFGLDRFFTSKQNESIEKLIHSTLETKDYDSAYCKNRKFDPYYVLIFQSKECYKEITFTENSLPKELDSLYKALTKYIERVDLTEAKPFQVDSLLIQYEIQTFEKYPRPPVKREKIIFKPPVIKPE